MSDYYYNFQTVMERVPGHIEELCRELYPEGKRTGQNWCVAAPEGGEGRSFQISLRPEKAGCYVDRADTSVKGNAISLVAIRFGMEYQEAGAWLGKFLGVQPEEKLIHRKNRPKPVIDKRSIHKLTEAAIAYAASRGIKQETLERFQCAAGDNCVIFPHFDYEGNTTLVKYWPTDGSKKMWTNQNPIHTLFGKPLVNPMESGGSIIITEGQWDAMAWSQLGYPAVSIPSGVANDNWIEEDWVFLNQFTEILLDFDNDQEGRDAEQRVRSRLGYERIRLLRYAHKDANEALLDGGEEILHKAYEHCINAPVEHIVNAQEIKHNVKARLQHSKERRGVPFFLSGMPDIEFRPHEATIWYGITGHGKSTAVMNQFCYQASLGIKGLIASFESNTITSYANLITQFAADPNIAAKPEFDEVYDYVSNYIRLFDSMERTKPEVMVATMMLAHKQLGICHFCIDNVMTLDVDRQDNVQQAAVANLFRTFVSRYPVHVHLLAHPRKAQDSTIVRAPQLNDIRGASEWSDMAHNAICVYRDIKKTDTIAQMVDEGVDATKIKLAMMDSRDGKFMIRKQRETGDHPICSYQFNKETKRFWRDGQELEPYKMIAA